MKRIAQKAILFLWAIVKGWKLLTKDEKDEHR